MNKTFLIPRRVAISALLIHLPLSKYFQAVASSGLSESSGEYMLALTDHMWKNHRMTE